MKILSLFSGIGGFDLAFRNKGHTIIGACEIDKYARSVYSRHFPGVRIYQDATKINPEKLEDFDCLCAGFPCQTFSIAGKRLGFEESRGTLFFEIIRIARIKKPKYMLLENVKGLLSHDNGKTIEVICRHLNEAGYFISYDIINSKKFVPQNRERIFITCTSINELVKNGSSGKFHLSKKIITEFLFQILLKNLSEKNLASGARCKSCNSLMLLIKDVEIGQIPNWKYWKQILLISRPVKNCCQIEHMDQYLSRQSSLDVILGTNTKQEYGTWQNQDTSKNIPIKKESFSMSKLLKNLLDAGLKKEERLYIISTALKQITELQTFTYVNLYEITLLLIIQLMISSPNLWTEILSDLTVIQEDTNYVKITHRTKETTFSESGNGYDTNWITSKAKCYFIINSGNRPRPEIFPIRENIEGNNSSRHKTQKDGSRIQDKLVGAIDANYHKGGGTRTMIGWSKSTRDWGVEQRFKIGEANTLNTGEGCRNQSTCNYVIQKSRVRRLTPLECERLQGFPDNYTEGLSDNQRYKCLGNAVTVPVVEYIVERLDSKIFVESTEKI